MSFLTEYQNRISTQLRTNLSNPQDSTSTTPDTTQEGYAAADVEGEFKKRGITPDSTLDTHVSTAISGIMARLMMFTGQPGGKEDWEAFKEDVRFLAETTSRDRISPSTDSLLSPTQDDANTLPAFDRRQFEGYIPGAPSQPTQND